MSKIKESIQFIKSISHLSKEAWMELWSKPFYTQLFIHQLYDIGYKSIPIIFIVSASAGLVLSLQFGFTLEKYGGILYVPQMLSVALFKEISPVFTSIILAGRVGAGIAADVSAMKVAEQIDAIRALGTSPIKRIVIPRILAAFIAIPLLSLFSCLVGYMFGALGSVYELNLDYYFFHHYFFQKLDLLNLASAIIKPFIFSYIIVITGCHFGFSVAKRSRTVGEVTTLSVVTSSLLILIANFILTKILLEI